MAWNGNTTEAKTNIANFVSFCVKFFRSVSIFRDFFVSVNGIQIFPLTDISVSINVNHTGYRVIVYVSVLVVVLSCLNFILVMWY